MKKTVFAGKPPRLSAFDLSHEHKLSCHMGHLIPVMCQEVIPGDTFTVNSDLFLRLMPLASPMMHRVEVYVHYFFVPTRLIWKNWDVFLTGGPDGNQTIEHPQMPAQQMTFVTRQPYQIGKLADYFGLPVANQSQGGFTYPAYSTLPFRAYNLIFNEWYRDETLQQPLTVLDTDGSTGESPSLYTLQYRAWAKGYFESALPWAQRGSGAVVPLDNTAIPVQYLQDTGVVLPYTQQLINNGHGYWTSGTDGTFTFVKATQQSAGNVEIYNTDGSSNPNNRTAKSANLYDGNAYPPVSADDPDSSSFGGVERWTGLVANAEESGAHISLQSLRLAAAIQRYQERNARGGVRYIEWLRAHFGVKSSDARLQRPEYLGGGKSPIVIGEVLQTSQSDQTPQGWMAGQAISAQRSNGFHRSFEEFGYIIGILSIRPNATYEQGMHRMWRRFGRYDQILPEFAGIGDQAVHNSELYIYGNDPDGAFGYVPRYEECRRMPSSVHGDFRVNGGSLGYWHLGRYFENAPQLTDEFIKCVPSKRVFAVQDGDVHECLIDIRHNVNALRPLPLNGEPGIRSL